MGLPRRWDVISAIEAFKVQLRRQTDEREFQCVDRCHEQGVSGVL